MSKITFNFNKYGTGTEILLCFHGFGESGSKFAFLEDEIGDRYTIYAFDFLYHGALEKNTSTDFPELSKDELARYFKDFLKKRNILQVHLMGYSMGGRNCLTLIETMPKNIVSCVLIAPDGVYNSFWFRFSTQTSIGKNLFRHFTYHPNAYFRVIEGLTLLKIISNKKNQIINFNTSSNQKRNQVFNTWMVLSKLKTDPKIIEKKLDDFNISFHVIAGKHDKVIPLQKIKKWPWLERNKSNLIVVHQGHLISEAVIIEKIKNHKLL